MPAVSLDAIVVGGGAIGLSVALGMRAHGWQVSVLEHRQPSFEVTEPERMIALSEGSRRLLDTLGVWPDIVAQGVGRIRHIVVCEQGGRAITRLHHHELHLDALGYVVEMRQILAPMWRRLQVADMVRAPARVTALEMDEHRVRLTTRGAHGRECLQGRLLLAADGAHSQMRRLLGITTRGWPHNRFAIVASVRFSVPHDDTAYECFRRAGPLALLPMADGRFSLVWAVDAKEAAHLLRMDTQAFSNALGAALVDTPIHASLGTIEQVGARASFPLTLQLARHLHRGRALLLGNAAHCIHPVAGQGMNLGLRDVAEWLTMMRTRRTPDSSVCLGDYAQRRMADIAVVTSCTEGLLAVTAPECTGLRAVRAMAMRMLQPSSPLKHRLLRHAAGVRA